MDEQENPIERDFEPQEQSEETESNARDEAQAFADEFSENSAAEPETESEAEPVEVDFEEPAPEPEAEEEPEKESRKKGNKRLKEEVERLTEENEALRQEAEVSKKIALQAAEFQTLYTRLKGDFDNYKRRNAEIAEKSKEDATVALAELLLPVLDNFGRALASIHDESIATGVRMIYQQFNDVLAQMNVEKYESLGEDFDHNLHDAVLLQEAGPEQAGKVINVILDGYCYGERVIRAAKVVVGKAPDDAE